ncbi:MAG: ABC transporter ATP-binding protein [Saprospiraceae bacterium]|nr:ABC transporter ATP-binding protein [Saprospiraceae bacterium]
MWKAYYIDFWRAHKVLLCIVWLSMLASNLLTIVLTLLIGKFFQLQFGLQTAKGNLLDFYPFSLATDLSSFYLMYGIILVLKIGFFFYARYMGDKVGVILIKNLKREVFNWQLLIPISYYRNTGAGRFMLRFSGDMSNIKKHFINGILYWSTDIVIIVLFFVIIFQSNLVLGCWMLGLLVTSTFILQFLDNQLYLLTEIQSSKSSRLFSLISTTLNHLETIHVINRNKIQVKTFNKLNEGHARASIQQSRQEAIYRTAIPFITYLLILCTLLVAGFQQDAIATSVLVSTILLILYITPVIRRVLSSGISREKGILSWKNIEKLKNLTQEEGGRDIKSNKINLRIRSGKDWQELTPGIHTLYHPFPHHYMDNWLLLRTLSKDKIVLNGSSIANLKASQWRKMVCPVDDRYGLVGKNLHELVCPHLRVIPENGLQKFNAILPPAKQLSLDMTTGENGKLLSPMQKKIVAIMRACYSSCPILIFRNLMEHIPPKKQEMVKELLQELDQDHVIILLEPLVKGLSASRDEDETEDDNTIVSIIK